MDNYRELSDGELVVSVRARDRDAYHELHRRHFDALRRQAKRLCRKSAEADQLAADVFTRFYLDTSAGGGPSDAVRPYLYRSLHEVAGGQRHRGSLKALDPETDSDEFAAYVGASGSGVAGSEPALRALRSLDDPAQAALWYADVERLSERETARILGVTTTQLEEIVARARLEWRRRYLGLIAAAGGSVAGGSVAGGSVAGGSVACARSAEVFDDWVDGSLTPVDDVPLRRHLAGCPECAAAFDDHDRSASALPGLVAVGALGSLPASAARGGPARRPRRASPSGASKLRSKAALVGGCAALVVFVTVVGVAAAQLGGDEDTLVRTSTETAEDEPTSTTAAAPPVSATAAAAATTSASGTTTTSAATTTVAAAAATAETTTTDAAASAAAPHSTVATTSAVPTTTARRPGPTTTAPRRATTTTAPPEATAAPTTTTARSATTTTTAPRHPDHGRRLRGDDNDRQFGTDDDHARDDHDSAGDHDHHGDDHDPGTHRSADRSTRHRPPADRPSGDRSPGDRSAFDRSTAVPDRRSDRRSHRRLNLSPG